LSSADRNAAAAALVLHAAVAWLLAHVPPRDRLGPSVVEVEVRKKPPPVPQLTPPPPPPEPLPPPPRKVVQKVRQVAAPPPAPPPNTPPKEPPKEPPKPVFGVTMESTTTGDSSFSVPVGNTTMIDPAKSAKHTGPVAPLPAAPAAPAKAEYKPVSELYIKTPPEIDGDACGHAVEPDYPEEALQFGAEGDVKLLISLDESGRVHSIKVLAAGPGHGLDKLAVNAMRNKRECRFKPAIATDGKPAAYELPYTFHFEIPH
jgi:protein TonB